MPSSSSSSLSEEFISVSSSSSSSSQVEEVNESDVEIALAQPHSSRHSSRGIKESSKQIDSDNEKISDLKSQLIIGALRDVTWGMLTYRNLDFFNGAIGPFWGTTLTQMIATPLLPIGLAASFTATFGCENKKAWMKKQAVYTFASWSSMLAWNGAQYTGYWIGDKLKFNTVESGYLFAGPLCGIAETIVQGAMVVPFFLNQTIEWGFVAMNTLSGTVWQWVYEANLPPADVDSNIEAFLVGLKIASGVAASTMLVWSIDKCCRQYHASQKEVTTPAASSERTEGSRLITGATSRLFPTVSNRLVNSRPVQGKDAAALRCNLF